MVQRKEDSLLAAAAEVHESAERRHKTEFTSVGGRLGSHLPGAGHKC